jgi:excisionase family DNA binding protein
MTEKRQLLSSTEVAALLGKSVRTVQRMAESGELPAIKLGERDTAAYVFDLDEVERYIGATAQ